MLSIRFNLKQLADLDEDLKKSVKSLPIVVQRALSLSLREVRREMVPLVPRGTTGQLVRSFGVSVTKKQGLVMGVLGFLTRRRSGRTIVAGNVLQKGGAKPSRRPNIWVPLPSNRNVTPRDFFNASNTFVRMSKAGNKIAFIRAGEGIVPLFVLKKSVKLSRPPLPISERIEEKLPDITESIQTTIGQVIAAKRAALEAL